jgi:NAD(P)-dependent dehydrogenase (short-subunit alcohol dehydrogenase family)
MNTKPVVLVTGASSGIGYVTAQTLAHAGYAIYGTSRTPDPAKCNHSGLQLHSHP